jgi:acyl-CoA synthetase (AMP-forming)/AMP-acid ligase II
MTLAGFEPLNDNPDAGADWARRLERHGDAPALLTADGAVVTYAELAARADEWAAKLGPGRRFVALLVRNDIASIIAYVGALRAGHPVLLLDADGDCARILADFAPDVVACPSDERLEIGAATTALHPDLALLLSTSGSTGSPKLVRLSGEAVAANGRAIVQYLGLTAAERAVTTLAIHYSFGLSVLNSHLMAGAALIVTDLSVTHPDFAALLERMRPTSLSGVPYIYELLERTGLEARLPGSITSLTQAGGRLPADKVRALATRGARQGYRFFAMYGQTEAAPRMAYLPPELAARFPDCIGRAIPGGAFTLEDGDGGEIGAPEVPGELVYRGPNVMMGYATSPADLAKGAELEALRTGDIAVRNEAGLYRITGRASRFAKIAGLRIGFDDVEALLAAAGQTAVVTGDDTLVAVHVEAADTPEARQAVAELVAEQAHIPESAVSVVSGPVPRLASGKTDYGAIRKAGAAAAEARMAALAGAHPILAGYARAFGRPDVAPAESFQSLGGDSLAYVNAAMSVEKALGHLPARWEEMPVSALIALAPVGGTGGVVGQSRIATETLLRLLALTLVILGHAAAGDTGILRGGATILFMMAGYNVCRFQKSAFEAGRLWPALAGTFERMILPYLVLMTPVLLLSGATKNWGWFALVSVFTVDDAERGPLFAYWFIETVFHALLVTVLLFSVPAVRRLSAARPFTFGLLLLALALVAKLVVPAYVFDDRNPVSLTIDAQYYLYALGWLAFVARGRAQLLAVLALAVVLGSWDYGPGASRQLWLGLAMAALLFVPDVPVPRWLAGPLLRIAAAGYFIYIAHVMVNQVLRFRLGLDDVPVANLLLLLPLSIVAGLLFEAGWNAMVAGVRRLRRA